MSLNAKQAHRRLAIFIGLFIAVHFATHFAALGGIAAQDTVLQIGRTAYRFPLIEVALVIALAAQVVLGLRLLRQIAKRPRKGFWHKVQFVSGCYLAYFVMMHTGAALIARFAFELDTNFYWAAGTLVLDPLRYGFAPYYVLAVSAFVGHILAALHFRKARAWQKPALALGPLAGIAFILAYGGALYDIDLPGEYAEYFGFYPGVID